MGSVSSWLTSPTDGTSSGFPLSFGVFQQYYTNLPGFAGSQFITYIGTIATGITYLGAPILAPIVKQYPQYQRLLIFVGWSLCVMSLVAGSFANSIVGLVLTQGVLYGGELLRGHHLIADDLTGNKVGYLIMFYPVMSIVNEWWIARRGFAWGIMLGASGVSGVVYPFINEALLHKYGYQTALRAMALATLILTGPLLPFLKGRLPPSRNIILTRTDWSFLQKPIFWLYIMSTIAQSLGFYLPTLYLPAYASAAGLSPTIGATLLAVVNIASVLGQFTYGWLSDRNFSLNILLLSTSALAAISSLTLWGLGQSVSFLILFAMIYGFFAYAYLAMRVRIGTTVAAEPNDQMTMFCIFSFGQGIGNVLAGPISGALLTANANVDVHEYGYFRYRGLIIFTGVSMVASAACISFSYLIPTRLRS